MMHVSGGWPGVAIIGLVMGGLLGTLASLMYALSAMKRKELYPMRLLYVLVLQTSGSAGCLASRCRTYQLEAMTWCRRFLQTQAPSPLAILHQMLVS